VSKAPLKKQAMLQRGQRNTTSQWRIGVLKLPDVNIKL
jgi:hypothetical protein